MFHISLCKNQNHKSFYQISEIKYHISWIIDHTSFISLIIYRVKRIIIICQLQFIIHHISCVKYNMPFIIYHRSCVYIYIYIFIYIHCYNNIIDHLACNKYHYHMSITIYHTSHIVCQIKYTIYHLSQIMCMYIYIYTHCYFTIWCILYHIYTLHS